MQRKILFLVNPISGTKRKPALINTITKQTTAAGISFTISDTRADGDYSNLPATVLNDAITDVVICGGDGSVSAVTAHLLQTDVAVGIIPMGSGNGLALAAGIPNVISKALKIVYDGYSCPVDGFRINDRFSCMMCGIGSDAQIAHDFAKQKTRGLKTYLKLSALHYFRSRSYSFGILTGNAPGSQSPSGNSFDPGVGDKIFETEAFFITIANSNQFGNNITIAPKASLTDGLLDIVIVRKMHKLLLPFALLNQIAGANIPEAMNKLRKKRNIMYFQTPQLTVINNDKAPIHLDGEPQPLMERIHFKIVRNAFRLLQPPPKQTPAWSLMY